MGPRPNEPAPDPADPGTVQRPAGESPHVVGADSLFDGVGGSFHSLSGSKPTGAYPFLSPTDRPGELGKLGRYRIVKLLGKGGMGFVFQGEDDGLRRAVALKVMQPGVAPDPIARERFLREGRAAAAIKSDHVITIYDVGEENGVVYLAMEYLAGLNLEDWLRAWQKTRQAPVPPRVVVRLAKDILKGLMAAHDKGLIHRDIKTENLWVEKDSNRVKILDFGLTRGGGSDAGLTHTGQIFGTPTYMAPEQALGRKVDARADLFSVGVVLYRILTGASPFVRAHGMAAMYAVVNEPVPTVASLNTEMPDDLGILIDRLLAKNPDERPASAKAALAVVTKVERQLRPASVPAVPVVPPPPVRSPEPPRPQGPKPPEGILEEFEYEFESVKQPKRSRRVLKLDLGGGESMKFVWIEAGSFLMGAPPSEAEASDDEKPQRRVTISRGFYMGMYEVTQGQYKAVTGAEPSHFKGSGRLPVESVSWADAEAFCSKMSARVNRKIDLPTEAEWEYACRAGTTTPFHFGSTLNGDRANCDGNFPYGPTKKGKSVEKTVEVGSYLPNPWGLYDMHGNVWEWCKDYYGPYSAIGTIIDPFQSLKQSEDRRVLRGGSWVDHARYGRAASRDWFAPDDRFRYFGFRACLRLD